MNKNDLYLGTGIMGICLVYFYYTLRLPDKAATYPLFVGSVLIGLTLIFMMKTYLDGIKGAENKIPSPFAGFQAKQFMFVLATAVVYVALISILGYFASTFLYLIICLMGLKANRLSSLLTSIGYSAFVYVVFKILLRVPLPKGFLI